MGNPKLSVRNIRGEAANLGRRAKLDMGSMGNVRAINVAMVQMAKNEREKKLPQPIDCI